MLYFGTSYYPEQLHPADCQRDARLMKEAGFNLVRMGEFAWARMELKEGHFDFAWLEQAVETFAAHGIKSVLGTPTAAPPKWLSDRHPDICAVDDQGRRREFGRRRHYCCNSENYRRLTVRIVTELASHFRDNPHVIGYQIDNEFGAEQSHCYCETCTVLFRKALERKFGAIEELNRRWGMAFWSHTYGSFGEVVVPKSGYNPSSLLELCRFTSDSLVAYAKLQADCIRGISPEKIITHNVCSSGFIYRLDLNDLARCLDVVSLDNYPFSWTLETEYGRSGDFEYHPAMASFALAMTRSWGHAPFWITEAQAGRTLKPRQMMEPGVLRVWTHQEVAHGARAVLWFHWRQFPHGVEQMLRAVLDCDGVPRKRYYEIRHTIAELQKTADLIGNAIPMPEVALVRDFHTEWALEHSHFHPELLYMRHIFLYYRALFEQHVNADTLAMNEPLNAYKVVFAPSLVLVDEARAAALSRFAEGGGTLVLTCVSGLRNMDNVFHTTPFPSHLRELCGFEIVEQLAPRVCDSVRIRPLGEGWRADEYKVTTWMEEIELKGANPLAEFADRPMKGCPAVTVNTYGKGRVYYVATVPADDFTRELVTRILNTANVKRNVISSSSIKVETVKTTCNGKELLTLINYTRDPQTVSFAGAYQEFESGCTVTEFCELQPYSAKLLVQEIL